MSNTPAKRNIEIKAYIPNVIAYDKCVEIAKKLTKTNGEMLYQRDVFYNVSNGRLKLRMQNGKSMLVQYSRPDVAGPKLSEFDVLELTEPDILNRMLTNSLGVLGEVKKFRHLFLYGQTRIHLDKVEGLGTFLEFEICLRSEQTIDEGTKIANDLKEQFDVKDSQQLKGAYMDDLLKNKI